ncbi:hypothetical protein T11_10123 [Trichinella zimbabwensis]|uniref:Uncharacterized protein n=1 Tax=Trichinella zimbabwensis TaxID=268475 RepID=A0A0V1H8T0_9BILA|nr:hypothetical protein T11_10123 [Trichinella zimbabwensis]
MPQVRLAASSLMLEPVANTSICLDALCHNKNSSPAFVLLNGTGICRSRRCLGSFRYRFARWLYIVEQNRENDSNNSRTQTIELKRKTKRK